MQALIFPKTRTLLITLRAEHYLSGEASYSRHLKQILNDDLYTGDVDCNSIDNLHLAVPPTDDKFKATGLWQIFKTLRAKRYKNWTVLFKVPTLAPVWATWILCKSTGHPASRVTYIVDGLLLQDLKIKHLITLLYREPVLTVARLALNNPIWCFPLTILNLRYVFASKLQHKQGDRFITPQSNVTIIPNIADQINHQKTWSRRMILRSTTQIRMGYFGHTYYVKGLSLLAKALSKISADELAKPNITLAFSGRGSLTKAEAKQFSHYQQLGVVKREQFLGQVDVLIFPFIYSWGTNVFPSAVLEAASVGVPSILPKLPLNVELMGEDYPLYFKPNCAIDLARAISGLNPKILLEATNIALDVISNRHSQDNFFSSWSEIINSSG